MACNTSCEVAVVMEEATHPHVAQFVCQSAGWQANPCNLELGRYPLGGCSEYSPGDWEMATDEVIAAVSEYEIELPSDADQLLAYWDLTFSNATFLAVSIKIGGTYYSLSDVHTSFSRDTAATYNGSIIAQSASGASAGDITIETLHLQNLLSSLFPIMTINGGYLNAGDLFMTFGGAMRNTAGPVTHIKIAPSVGTISGLVTSVFTK